ncbi:MAG: hypothetical protein K0R25_1055 [Rickettsiaceae bacterium]|jgi:hypothetical protein|nr:hypothetical protein [Rickettsiaceae bacterium]
MTTTKNTKSEHKHSFWKTPIERAMFGFESEIDCNPKRFFNFEYIQGLLRQEANSLRTYSKTFTTLLILNSLALFYMRGIQLNLSIAGFGLQNIPASAEIICLFLGLNIFGFSIYSLNIILFSRIRYAVIHRLVGTDLVNMALVHLKDNGLWIDLLTPRFIGYSSGKAEKLVSWIFMVTMMLFSFAIFLASAASIWSLYKFILETKDIGFYSIIISSTGLVMGILGFLIFIFTQYIPCKFTCPLPISATPDSVALSKVDSNKMP